MTTADIADDAMSLLELFQLDQHCTTQTARTLDQFFIFIGAHRGQSSGACQGMATVSQAGEENLSFQVPGDISGSAFWGALAAGIPGSVVEIENLGLNPSRTALLDILRRSGAEVDVTVESEAAGEPIGRVRISCADRRSFSISPAEVPAVIDELPALGALGTLLPEGSTMEVRGAAELRVKESDRISALVAGFRALGIDADERDDGFVIRGRSGERPKGGVADARGDHRMAMAFAIAALAAEGPSTIDGAEAVDISYPGFFETLERLVS